MRIISPAFAEGEAIPKVYSCDGDNINPPLEFEDIPENAKSLVLVMDDPDVPKNLKPDGMFDHWVVFNIPPEITTIDEDSQPLGVVGKSSTQESEYTGPCPPDRQHRYFFKLYALDTLLDLDEEATKKDVEEAIKGHVIEKAQLMGVFAR